MIVTCNADERTVAPVIDGKALMVCSRGEDKLRAVLAGMGVKDAACAASAGEARRIIARENCALVVINAPLTDETGLELALELAQSTLCAVVLLVKAELLGMVYGPATDAGVLVVGKPIVPQIFQQMLMLGCATRNRMLVLSRENEKLQKRLEEIRLIDRAKCLLIERRRITEAEAHRAIEKQAMDDRLSRVQVARIILERYEL